MLHGILLLGGWALLLSCGLPLLSSTSWIRTGRGWRDIDFAGYPLNMRQVRNHPSIVMWEAANHTQSFKDKLYSESNRYVEAVYEMMHPEAPSRLLRSTTGAGPQVQREWWR